nr:hypothetical protein [Angustibacter aerolatus]
MAEAYGLVEGHRPARYDDLSAAMAVATVLGHGQALRARRGALLAVRLLAGGDGRRRRVADGAGAGAAGARGAAGLVGGVARARRRPRGVPAALGAGGRGRRPDDGG